LSCNTKQAFALNKSKNKTSEWKDNCSPSGLQNKPGKEVQFLVGKFEDVCSFEMTERTVYITICITLPCEE